MAHVNSLKHSKLYQIKMRSFDLWGQMTRGHFTPEVKCPLHHFDSLSEIVLATKLSGLTLQS